MIRNSRDITWVIALVAIWVLRTCLILYWMDPVNEDAYWGYIPLAQNIFSGRGYSMAMFPPYLPTAYRAPGYPLFLALFYCPWPTHPQIAIFIQAMADGLTALLIYYLARHLDYTKTCARLASLFFLLYPFSLKFTATFFRDNLFAFLITLAIYLFYRARKTCSWKALIPFTIILSLSIYLREDGLLFWGLFLLFWCFFHRHSKPKIIKGCSAMFLSLILIIGPWTLRNYAIFRTFIPISSMEFSHINWPRGNLDVAEQRTVDDLAGSKIFLVPTTNTPISTNNPFGFLSALRHKYLLPLLDKKDAPIAIEAGQYLHYAQKTYARPEQFATFAQPMKDMQLKYIKSFPGSFGLIMVHRFFHYAFSSRTEDLLIKPNSRLLLLFLATLHLFLIPIGLFGLATNVKTRILILPALMPFALMAFSGWPEQRYAMPSIPLFCLGMAIVLTNCLKVFNRINFFPFRKDVNHVS